MTEKNRHLSEVIAVRTWLEGSVGNLWETTWEELQSAGYVKEYLNAKGTWQEEVARKDLRRAAEDGLKLQRKYERESLQKHGILQEPRTGDPEIDRDAAKPEHFKLVPRIELPEREKKRTDVLLKISMRQAAERMDVKRFRSERLGGQRLLYDDAWLFIDSGMLREEITDWELADLAERLERDYGWRRDDAAWFVLTDRSPRLRPLNADVSMLQSVYGPSHCKISLHVAPWVPSEAVERAFVQIRDEVRGGAGPGTVGEQRLEVLRFVEEKRTEDGRRPNFEALLQMWNQEHPHWAYADYRALAKAYREAYREVVYPKYGIPKAERPEA